MLPRHAGYDGVTCRYAGVIRAVYQSDMAVCWGDRSGMLELSGGMMELSGGMMELRGGMIGL